MDPFEVRMQFLTLLRRLNASQQSIQKVVTYALKYFSRCGEDLWDCLVEECQKGSINTRINILYLLDTLCETSLLSKAHSAATGGDGSCSFYLDFVARDLGKIVEYVVPDGREGLPNLMSATQILDNWRSKRIIDPQKVEEIITRLHSRKTTLSLPQSDEKPQPSPSSSTTPPPLSHSHPHPEQQQQSQPQAHADPLPRSEIFKRIEEDRERHKRLRERRWVQPLAHALGSGPVVLATFLPMGGDDGAGTHCQNQNQSQSQRGGMGIGLGFGGTGGGVVNKNINVDRVTGTGGVGGVGTGGVGGEKEKDATSLTLDIEFDNEWETTSDWNEDDEEAAAEENALCYGYGGGGGVPNTQASSVSVVKGDSGSSALAGVGGGGGGGGGTGMGTSGRNGGGDKPKRRWDERGDAGGGGNKGGGGAHANWGDGKGRKTSWGAGRKDGDRMDVSPVWG
ncbi:hypothetical protein BD410DRAFT_787796 [Rickenella mellea]|uniref:CID domain-containing protein n=1 Tax=Rickenella mellea TaxID=50990 RepID=A0A4Y7Q5P7_9AGAM|nr:hypothetical protein BD410DRAFT_787796 [Rickenella mellea]